MYELSKELTIVIPTKNRPIWLKRIFIYYSKLRFKGVLLIADSSDEELFNKIKKIALDYKDLNIKLSNYPNLNCETAIYAASKEIKTNYSVFLADDDILLMDGLVSAVDFLKKNKNIVGAVGNSYMFGTINNKPFGSINSALNYNLRSYDDISSLERIKEYFFDIKALCFAVVNTEIFKESYKITMNLDEIYQTYILGENLQAICYLSKGKIIKLDNEYLIRQHHKENNYHKINKKNWLNVNKLNIALKFIKDYAKSQNNIEDYDKIENLLKKYFDKLIINLSVKDKTSLYEKLKKNIPIMMIKHIKYLFFDSKNVKKFKKTDKVLTYFKIIEHKNYE